MARYRTPPITMAAAHRATTRFDEGRGNGNAADNPYADFFGPLPAHLVPQRADSAYPHESWALPFAYQGRNKFLESVLGKSSTRSARHCHNITCSPSPPPPSTDFLITSGDDWYTSILAPFERTDEIHVSWSIFKFDRQLADYEPGTQSAIKVYVCTIVRLRLITHPRSPPSISQNSAFRAS